jgi:hypothetical protein
MLKASNITSRTTEYIKAGTTLQCIYVCHLTQFAVGIQDAPTALVAPAAKLNPDMFSAVLDASKSFDSQGGSIQSYQWQFLPVVDGHSMPSSLPAIMDPKSPVTFVSGLSAGHTYQFQVVVEDNDYAIDTAVQNITIKPWAASYSMEASATTISLNSELIVTVSILDTERLPINVQHEPCSIQVSFYEGHARNGQHFAAYNQTLSFASNQSVAVSAPVLALFDDDEASFSSTSSQALDFSIGISSGTQALPYALSLSTNVRASVHIILEPVFNTNQDIVSFSYTANTTKDALILHLFLAKQAIATVLGVARNNVLLGLIWHTGSQPSKVQSVEGNVLPVKVLTRQGDAQSLVTRISSMEFLSALHAIIPQGPTLGSLGQISVSSR